MTTLHHHTPTPSAAKQLNHLVKQRRQLTSKLEKLDSRIAKLAPNDPKAKSLSPGQLDALLDQLASSSPPTRSLPTDFSRADIYNDHD